MGKRKYVAPVRRQPRRRLNTKTIGQALKVGAAAYTAYQTYAGDKERGRVAGSTSATQTIVKRKNEKNVYGSGVDMDKYTYSSGLPMSHNLNNAWKLLESSRQRINLRWSRITRFDVPGAIPLLNSSNTFSAVTTQYVPVHAYDISSFVNNLNGSIGYATPGSTLSFQSPSLFNWTALTGTSPSGTDTTSWFPEDTVGQVSGNANTPLRRDLWNYISVKMNLYGTVQRPTKYKLQMVQFNQAHLVPANPGNTDISPGSSMYDEARSFWEYMAKPYTFSNLNDQPAVHAKNVKVLKAWDFIINPPESTETLSSTPHFKECNIFMRMNRVQKYDEQPKGTLGSVATDVDSAKWQSDQAEFRPYVKPTDRVFLIVRALASSGTATTLSGPGTNGVSLFDVNYHPSYDIVLKTSHDVIE